MTRGGQAHPWNEIILIQRGVYQLLCGNRVVHGTPGSVIHLPAGRTHCFVKADTNLALVVIGYSDPRTQLVATRQEHSRDTRGAMASLVETMRRVWPGHGPRDKQALGAMFDSLLYQLEQNPDTQGHDLVNLVEQYLWTNYAKPLYLDQIAAYCDMSPSHLNRQYRKLTGSTPKRRLAEIRAEVARQLLTTTNEPSNTIASLIGLAGATQLYRLIRRYFDCSPAELRRRT
jgi:AraC-like DNA-binding protein